MKPWMLETDKLTKTIQGETVVSDVEIQIAQGDIYGFLGPNGAGKTTTIRMLLGLARPTQGKIRIFGKDLRKERLAILRKVGSLVEYPSYYGHLSARENLEALRRLLDVPRSRIGEVLDLVRLTGESHRPVKGFSLGMKQRLGIAAALLGQPELLILDEPTNGLDPAGIQEIRELIKRMPRELGMTILVSSHLLSEMEQMATKVGIITKGRMIFQDSIQTLQAQAQAKVRLVVSDPESAWRQLLAAGYDADWDRSRLTVKGASDTRVAAMVASLIRQDFDIYRVETEGTSLERIFLDMTGGEGSL